MFNVLRPRIAFLWVAFFALTGCAEGVKEDGSPSAGGSDSTGGTSSTGGTTVVVAGGSSGSSASGGTGATASGGTSGTGGASGGSGGASGGSGGASGGSGGASGGSGGTGGATGGSGGGSTVPLSGDLAVQYMTTDDPHNGDLKPQFNVCNRGTQAMPVADLTIRYFYTIDGTAPNTSNYQELHLDYADITRLSNNSTTVSLSFAKYEPPQTGADHYIEVSFVGPYELPAGQCTNQIQVRVNWLNYTTNYDETNDYSWDGTITTFTDSATVTLYQNGVLIWGIEPDGTTPALPSDAGADASPSSDAGSSTDAASATDASDAGPG